VRPAPVASTLFRDRIPHQEKSILAPVIESTSRRMTLTSGLPRRKRVRLATGFFLTSSNSNEQINSSGFGEGPKIPVSSE